MTRIWVVPAICIFGYFSFAIANQQEDQAVGYLKNWVAQVKGQAPPAITSPELPPIKCGTPAFIAASYYNRRYASPDLVAAIARPVLPDTYGTQHFVIHYTTVGADSVYQPRIDSLLGVSRHVTRVAGVLEHIWSKEIDTLGYQTPPTDFGNGGDNRFDIYLVNLGFGLFGFTVPESTVAGYRASSFIELENDFAQSIYVTHPLDAVKVTAAHEFFHAIQFSYDASEFDATNPNDPSTYKPWWEEASSTWMENVVYPDIKDYLGYLPFFYKYMWLGLGVFSSSGPEAFHPYASCIWPMYMTKRFNNLDLMRQIWQICGQVPGYNTLPATNTVLSNHGSDLPGAFLEFETWNFQTGPLADTINAYTDGHLFPAAETTAYVNDLTAIPSFTIPNNIRFPQQFAANYIVLQSIPNSPGGVIANFNGQDLSNGQGWHVALMGFRVNDSRWVDIQVNPSSGVGGGAWAGWNNYREIILIPTVTGLNPNYSTFTYTGTLTYDSTLTGGQGVPMFGLSQAYPSPYVISNGDLLTIPYSLDRTYSKSNLEMAIYDVSGALVQKIPSEMFLFTDPGQYSHGIQWNGKNSSGDYIASGIYIVLFKAGDNTARGKIAVINSTR